MTVNYIILTIIAFIIVLTVHPAAIIFTDHYCID